MADVDSHSRQISQEYLNFLDDNEDQWIYQKRVKDLIADGKSRLIVNINDLRHKNSNRAAQLLSNGFEELIGFQKALKTLIDTLDPTFSKQHDEFYVGLEGSFGARHLSPRTLTCSFLGNMVCIEGIVSKCSLVRPKIACSVHYCPATKKTLERKYTDMTSLDAFPTSGVYPTKDDDGNLLETEYGLSIYKDHQTFTIQEMPEKAPAGQLPRSVDVIADNDLIDNCKPGDRVQVIGLYRCLPSKKNSYTSCTFRTILVANNIQLLNKEIQPTFSEKDIKDIKKFSKQKADVFEVLAHSLAPTIHGHEYIKKAILCMLLGGVERVLENGTRIRGDINLLLIGDPSVAKSQLLRYVLFTAPRAVTTTGRGSSGVGLTAAVTTDHETGERRLEAGAMVLADRGIVCIDEFDKMSDMDRTAIHEVMEQGRVTIAKAGIHAKLNARCSVLAAANPVYGRYNQYKTPMENIGLQDSLLSRFDLLFIVLDINDAENDRKISDHILRIHRYRNPGEQDGAALPLATSLDLLTTEGNVEEDHGKEEVPIYEKFHNIFGTGKKKDQFVSVKFMRKYLHVAKDIKPQMTRDAADYIAEEYSKLRNQDMTQDNVAKTQPITARSLETMIRLSTAHAKCRLSKLVEVEDAHAALELVHFAYFKKVLQKTRRRKRSANEDGSDDEDGGDDDDVPKPRQKRKRVDDEPTVEESMDIDETPNDPYNMSNLDKDLESQAPRKVRSRIAAKEVAPSQSVAEEVGTSQVNVSAERLQQFKSLLLKLFQSGQSLALEEVIKSLGSGRNSFTKEEIMFAIDEMQNLNQIMLAGDTIYLI